MESLHATQLDMQHIIENPQGNMNQENKIWSEPVAVGIIMWKIISPSSEPHPINLERKPWRGKPKQMWENGSVNIL